MSGMNLKLIRQFQSGCSVVSFSIRCDGRDVCYAFCCTHLLDEPPLSQSHLIESDCMKMPNVLFEEAFQNHPLSRIAAQVRPQTRLNSYSTVQSSLKKRGQPIRNSVAFQNSYHVPLLRASFRADEVEQVTVPGSTQIKVPESL